MKTRLDLSIGQRLSIGFGAAAALLAGLVYLSHYGLDEIRGLRRQRNEILQPRADAVDDVEAAILYASLAARTYVLLPEQPQLDAFQHVSRRLDGDFERLTVLSNDPDTSAAFASLPERFRRFERNVHGWVSMAAQRPSPGTLRPAERELTASRDALLEGVKAIGRIVKSRMATAVGRIESAQERLERGLPVVTVVVLLLLGATAMVTVRSVRRPVGELVAAARGVSAGDYVQAKAMVAADPVGASFRDELAVLSDAFGRMAVALQRREQRLAAGARFSSVMTSSLEVARLCRAGLEEIVGHLGADVGAVYVRSNGDGTLHLQAEFGLAGLAPEIAEGEGLLGEAVRGHSSLTREIPADSPLLVRYGVADLRPRTVAAVPMLGHEEVAGAILVGSMRELCNGDLEFVEQAALQLAISVHNAMAHEHMERLAADLQVRNEELQAQREEIQAQNEELQAQGEEIQAQNEELQSQNEELQQQQEELRISSETLRDVDRRKNEFLAMLSHELRNPLAPILTSLQVLDRTPPGSDQARRAQAVIARQARHLTRLVEDLLDVNRITHDKVTLQRGAVDLVPLARQAADDNEQLFRAAQVELHVQGPAAPLWVDGDPARLAQVLGNVLTNAAKFTPAGGHVWLSLDRSDDSDAVIRVRDSGVGMTPEVLSHLFEPFVQGDGSLARTKGGLGLGLVLVKGIVALHGGTVRATSEGPGKGSEIDIKLPAGRPPAAPAAPPHPPLRAAARRVLIIEDNIDAAESLRDVIELIGFSVEVAFNGLEGLRKAQAAPPDVILCDLGLPGMDGYAVARAARELDTLRGVLLIALTGYALPEDQRRAIEAGFDAHIAKPASLDAIAQLLGARPAQTKT